VTISFLKTSLKISHFNLLLVKLLLHHEIGETKTCNSYINYQVPKPLIPKVNNGDNNATTNNKEDIATIRDRPW
jgi:hypothetical protein